MKLGYTEFSFGYAFTENLVRSTTTGPAGAPVFPNLVQEAQLGYDVSIDLPGFPLFFQFKLPELMVRDTAKEISDYALPRLTTPFFRMPLMRRDLSNQHQLLIDLETGSPGSVFYVTPVMQDQVQFNTAYCAQSVHQSCFFFSPTDIGPLPDDQKHSIAYQQNPKLAWFCSEPKPAKPLDYRDISGRLRELFSDSKQTGDLNEAAGKAKQLVYKYLPAGMRNQEDAIRARLGFLRSALPEQSDLDEDTMAVSDTLVVTRELARIGLGVDMVIAQPRAEKPDES